MKILKIEGEINAHPVYLISDIYLCECLTFSNWLLGLDGEISLIINNKRFHFDNKNDRKIFLDGFFLAYDGVNDDD